MRMRPLPRNSLLRVATRNSMVLPSSSLAGIFDVIQIGPGGLLCVRRSWFFEIARVLSEDTRTNHTFPANVRFESTITGVMELREAVVTTTGQTAVRHGLDRRRGDPCAGGLRKRALASSLG